MYGINLDTDPTIDVNPTDIMTGHSEAFANVILLAPAGDKLHKASIRVKINTGAGGNIMPLQLFHQMYPDQEDQQGLPTGLNTNTNLIVCLEWYQDSTTWSLEHLDKMETTQPRAPMPAQQRVHC